MLALVEEGWSVEEVLLHDGRLDIARPAKIDRAKKKLVFIQNSFVAVGPSRGVDRRDLNLQSIPNDSM